MPKYPEAVGYKDRGGSTTSRDAAEAFQPKALTLRERVMNRLLVGPQTAEQVADAINVHWMIVRARLSELRAAGQVTPTGEKGSGALGGKVIIWRRTTEDERTAFLDAKEVELG